MVPSSELYASGWLGATNCGRKARKNSAVLTFNASTAMPSTKARRRLRLHRERVYRHRVVPAQQHANAEVNQIRRANVL